MEEKLQILLLVNFRVDCAFFECKRCLVLVLQVERVVAEDLFLVLESLGAKNLQFGHDPVEALAQVPDRAVAFEVFLPRVVQDQLFEVRQVQQGRHSGHPQLVVDPQSSQQGQLGADQTKSS